MKWNWQQPDWPHFSFDQTRMEDYEKKFIQSAGFLLGAYTHIAEADKPHLLVDMLSNEAIKTSAIEGEILNRDSVQASLLRKFGLQVDNRKIPPAEQGVTDMLVDVYTNYMKPLTHETLFNWNKMLTHDRSDLQVTGAYRSHIEPMQIVSGAIYAPKVHFEAPPSIQIPAEMDRFIDWFNTTSPEGNAPLSVLTRMAIAHWYFVCIHPFEDGNGRIARAIAQKALSQALGQPVLLALSYTIEKNKKNYYRVLETNSYSNEITSYLIYFADTMVVAENYTQKMINFVIAKTKLYDNLRGLLNVRQEKVLARLFQQGIEGFTGGLSADKYISIAKTSRATATRDLQDLVEKQALIRVGELKGTRYFLNINI